MKERIFMATEILLALEAERKNLDEMEKLGIILPSEASERRVCLISLAKSLGLCDAYVNRAVAEGMKK